jgi:hypothetical protein
VATLTLLPPSCNERTLTGHGYRTLVARRARE